MLRLSIILLFICSFAYGQTDNIYDGESGLDVLNTLNEDIDKGNSQADTLVVHRTQIAAIMDSLNIHRGELNDHTDSITALRASIILNDADIADLVDSIAAHRVVLDNHTDSLVIHNTKINVNIQSSNDNADSITDHRVVLDNHTDSIADHRTELNNAVDSLAQHRIELDNHTDTLVVFRDSLNSYDTRIDAAGTSVWTKTGTNLSPTTSGDDILLSDATERLAFGDGTNYINESSNVISFTVEDNLMLSIAGTNWLVYGDLLPGGDKTIDIGNSSSLFFDEGYFDRLYIDNTSTYIDVSGTDMSLTSADAGTVLLADLAAGTSTASYTSCTYNATTNIIVEAVSVNTSYQLHYMAKRDIGTVQLQSGNITIHYDAVSGAAPYTSSYIPDTDLGFEIEADYNGGNIRLNIIVDNAYSENVSFDYKIVSKFTE